ncbi:unnamed protein product [Trichogramma brassicae]|uniref:Uncharacterized protein n=1 Tax=Trichogramma brassicae TaxID=86971 RepID=A0A6H5I987_9HYME|nr:unnamed protein product [Trichogramma brassicae]
MFRYPYTHASGGAHTYYRYTLAQGGYIDTRASLGGASRKSSYTPTTTAWRLRRTASTTTTTPPRRGGNTTSQWRVVIVARASRGMGDITLRACIANTVAAAATVRPSSTTTMPPATKERRDRLALSRTDGHDIYVYVMHIILYIKRSERQTSANYGVM